MDSYADIIDTSDNDMFLVDSDVDDYNAINTPKRSAGERGMFVWLIPLLTVLSASSFLVIEDQDEDHPGSGNYDRTPNSDQSTRSMRLRLPDPLGQITPIGTRAYRLLNWKDLCYRFTHCTSDCLTLLVEKIRPWLALPRLYSEGFFNPNLPLPNPNARTHAEYLADAQRHNPRGAGRHREVDYYDETITFLSRVTQCASFASESVSILMSVSSIHRVMEHTAWAIFMGLAGIISVPSAVDLYQMAYHHWEHKFITTVGLVDDIFLPIETFANQQWFERLGHTFQNFEIHG
jgi:hypothetical protein